MSALVFPLVTILAAATVLAAFTALALALVFEAQRRRGARNLLLALAVVASLAALAFVWAFLNVRQVEFWFDRPHLEVVARRGSAVVEAIEAYELDHARSPEGLHELVPEYLAEVPTTGWSAHPSFQYRVGNGRWSLWVDTDKLFAFDTFSYEPERQHYEEPGYTDRIGDWLYVHE
jgi:hypothetical protein